MKRIAAILVGGSLAFSGASGTGTLTDVIPLHVIAQRDDGSSAIELRPTDFEVSVDSQVVPIESVSSGDAVELSAILMLDVSYSVSPAPLDVDTRFRDLVAAVSWPRNSRQAVAMGLVSNRGVFGAFATDGRALRSEWSRLVRPVQAAERFGPSPLWDALDEARELLAARPAVRAAVLWTDGRPTGNNLGATDLARQSATANVLLYVIAQGEEPLKATTKKANLVVHPCAVFDAVVRETGGACLVAERRGLTASLALARILRELHSIYTLRIVAPAGTSGPHKVDVRAKVDHIITRTRLTY